MFSVKNIKVFFLKDAFILPHSQVPDATKALEMHKLVDFGMCL